MDWKKALIFVLDIVIGVYLVLAMTAFNKPDPTRNLCAAIQVDFEKGATDGFLTANDVKQLLYKSHLSIVGQPMEEINTRQIEELLQGNDLIERAECYKAQCGQLRINIVQRIPIIRVMADNGDSYFVDTHGELMPSIGYTCDLLIATGHISRKYASSVLTPVATTIMADNFWKNQVEQLNILSDGTIEMVPRVGEHIAYLGHPTNLSSKLKRLRQFYRYGLNVAGWNKYSRISVEFDNQIVCKRRDKKKKV